MPAIPIIKIKLNNLYNIIMFYLRKLVIVNLLICLKDAFCILINTIINIMSWYSLNSYYCKYRELRRHEE